MNEFGVKIGADELPAVTQLFTEPYMVRFLLHNTLGAWWAGKVLAADVKLAKDAADEMTLRSACALPRIDWEYLRFVREGETWRPAAGIFPGWPQEAKVITVMDPCCGSGHFLVEAFSILAALRIKEEKLTPAAAAAAVLGDNLFGLELDGRCVQIASFAIALAAWRLGGSAVVLPNPHIAWVGAPPPLPRKEFVALANGNAEFGEALGALHDLFVQAPLLGSLLRPTGGDLVDPQRVARIEIQLDPLVARLRAAEPDRAEGAIAARGMADATELLARRYVLQSTNVPYLGRGKQVAALADHLARNFPDAKADLATALLMRMVYLALEGGTIASVTPQNWLFLGSYTKMRNTLLRECEFNAVCDLGPAAFNEMNWWAARTALVTFSRAGPSERSSYLGINADTGRDLAGKPHVMSSGPQRSINQFAQLKNPDHRILIHEAVSGNSLALATRARSFQGIKTGDDAKLRRYYWELEELGDSWNLLQTTVESTRAYGGLSGLVNWAEGGRSLARLQGVSAHGISAVPLVRWAICQQLCMSAQHLTAMFRQLYQ